MIKTPLSVPSQRLQSLIVLVSAAALSVIISIYLASGLGQHFGDVLLAALLLFAGIELTRLSINILLNPAHKNWQQLFTLRYDSYSRGAMAIALTYGFMQIIAAGQLQDILLGTLFFSGFLYFVCFPMQHRRLKS
ncbi:hypothetical protein [Pseudoteredinibacter isoporae]|uniref:Uncharacterized protein n=1 Tax=Pseudoteredinibacter isoporae TaxID=570281 RepID=A0A7X0MV14_9GAMM|nr:hypothetical protein [Pseudoteredinibacter isoporae]MBB6520605.1 hypothetical protein [Pseudoteredinibacter isoporae]NHO86172.1 hypothetical protein [Pseudoteredinibacter isoporae]NIB25377.1 hypothetical protein [Pseudoteredinibacter isoporae]